jgi:putative addiction module component (TIGR02574 family)
MYNRYMSSPDLFNEARHLPVSERLELIDQLIDSVEVDSAQSLSPELESELDRRYSAFLAKPDEGDAWEVVRERIQRNLDAARTRRQA